MLEFHEIVYPRLANKKNVGNFNFNFFFRSAMQLRSGRPAGNVRFDRPGQVIAGGAEEDAEEAAAQAAALGGRAVRLLPPQVKLNDSERCERSC